MSDLSPDAPTAHRTAEETPTIVVGDKSPAEQPPSQLTPGTVLGGRYRIVSLIGQGGMGAVYRADDLKIGQTIAAKFLSRGGGDEQRLYEEVRIGREIAHPNVCRLYDIADVDGHLFITMEFIDGEDLSSLLKRIGRLSADKALAVARDICSGLAAAHEKGVIHRDLKPANVLIDGRGRARITDFGLAIAEDSARSHVLAGTIAYMAPEQLTGGTASKLSDIYGLGLVLYEVFTGKRTFEAATSTHELVRMQNATDFARPMTIARDIEPAMERLIIGCLDPNPGLRPQSVEEILRQMPGRDALSAAVAAGETPTPAMVAAAAERGDLPLRIAAPLLLIALAALVGYALVTSKTMLLRRLPILESPQVLEVKAKAILAGTGHALPRADSESGFFVDQDERAYRETHHELEVEPTAMLFLYRQSPRPMAPRNGERRVVTDDPPLNVSGMADVTLDAAGRLVELTIAPLQVEVPAPTRSVVDWSPLLAHAAVEGPATPVAPRWNAPVDSDQKQAWIIGSARTRVEAASMRGKPVWFAVIRPWTRPERMTLAPMAAGVRSAFAVIVFLMIALPIVVLLLARRNLRRGRIDRKGAFRIAALFFVSMYGAVLFRAHHTLSFVSEWMLLSRLTADAVFWGMMLWIAYVAIEPLVRRRWPHLLIGWSRLLDGRWRDPIVGRDLLVGSVAFLLVFLIWHLAAWMTAAMPIYDVPPLAISGLRHVVSHLFMAMCAAILRTMALATVLVALYALVRNVRVVFAIIFVLASVTSAVNAPTGSVAMRLVCVAIGAITALYVIDRFGLLALSAGLYTMLALRALPITLDSTAWYFGHSLLGLALLAALMTYAFIVSLGGKRWLPELKWDD